MSGSRLRSRDAVHTMAYGRHGYRSHRSRGSRTARRHGAWSRRSVISAVSYGGARTKRGRASLRKKGAVAIARQGQRIQTEAELKKYLNRQLPHIKLNFSPYTPPVVSVVQHGLATGMLMVPTDESELTGILSFRPLDPFDPLAALGSGTTTGHTHFAALYNHYIVNKCEYKITFRNFYRPTTGDTEETELYACIQQDAAVTLPGQFNTIKELRANKFVHALRGNSRIKNIGWTQLRRLPEAKMQNVASSADFDGEVTPGVVTISGSVRPEDIAFDHLGSVVTPDAEIRKFIGLTGASPAADWFLNCFALNKNTWDTTAMDNRIKIDIELIQHVTWFEPRVDQLDELTTA